MRVAALFAGIGGLELGLRQAGHTTVLLSEIDPAALAVLRKHFPAVERHPDVRDLTRLPPGAEVVTAGFPCQDLSQAGRTAGIGGAQSGVVTHLFRLLERSAVPRVVIENVPFMLQLERGSAMRWLTARLEELGYHWAYRVVDTRAFGLPQRRKRVYLVAGLESRPEVALFAEERAPSRPASYVGGCGFYWTEGTRGLGWAVGAVPTLKGGSSLGIPSPPGVWLPGGRIVSPGIEDAERQQGFPPGWTEPAERVARRGHRWKLVGNAVSVPVARWLGEVVLEMHGEPPLRRPSRPFARDRSWPAAAFGGPGRTPWAVTASTWPRAVAAPPIADFLRAPQDLSHRAVSGFLRRLTASSLRYPEEFLQALRRHEARMRARAAAQATG